MGITTFNKLKLTLPKKKVGEHLLVETRIDILSAWLKSLPYGNMKVTLPTLVKSLSSFNRTDVPLSSRQSAMELFNSSYIVIADYYRSKSFKHDKRQSKFSSEENQLFYQLSKEMAYGFKCVSVQYAEEKGANETLARILNLTIYYLSLVLMHHYDVYGPVPKNIWKEIHSILGFAMIYDLIDIHLENSNKTGCLKNIEQTYLRITLVAMCNPYHLNRGQHWPLWRYLSYWVKNAELNEDLNDFKSDHTFIVNLKSDDRPILQESLSGDIGTENLLLSTQPLIHQIIRQIDELKSTGKPPLPGFGHEINATKARKLLEIMMFHWQVFKKRLSPRYQENQRVKVICGIRQIHKELHNLDPLSLKDDFNEFVPSTPSESKHDEIVVNKDIWHSINKSSGGLCLNIGPKNKTPEVGNIIAINEQNNDENDRWSLAVIRWLQKSRIEGITIGVELISGELQPVLIKILGIDERHELGILISGEEIQGKTTPTLIYKNDAIPQDQVVVMVIGDADLAIKPLRKIIETLSFERVFYQTRELSEAYSAVEDEQKAAEEEQQRRESGEEVIELTSIPGFTQVEKVDDDFSYDIEEPKDDEID